MTTNIYILNLEGGRFYVGKSENPIKRYQEHLNGSGSAWTKKYKPIGLEKVIENQTDFDEDKWVKVYMSKYGIEKVRGGAYVEIELDEAQEYALNRELRGVKDLCTTCGRQGHWAKSCYAKVDASGNKIYESDSESESEEEVYMCSTCRQSFTNEKVFEKHNCKSSTKKTSIYICGDCDKEFTSQNLFEKHKCKSSTKKTTGACYRCGRPGHYSPDCYARTHKDGYDLDSDDD